MGARLLTTDEIEVRVQECRKSQDKSGYVSLMLYKTARTDMKILDELYGEMNWQTHYRSIDGKMYCDIEVWDESKKCWIHKENVGTEANMEAEKSEASDAMKRAGFLWGIGRELYSAPRIVVYEPYVQINTSNGKNSCYDRFSVKEIECGDNRKIKTLVIWNETRNCECFSMKDGIIKRSTPQNTASAHAQNTQQNKPVPAQQTKQEPVNPVQQTQQKQTGGLVCADCGTSISEKVAGFSEKVYGVPYCMKCQKNHQRIQKSA